VTNNWVTRSIDAVNTTARREVVAWLFIALKDTDNKTTAEDLYMVGTLVDLEEHTSPT